MKWVVTVNPKGNKPNTLKKNNIWVIDSNQIIRKLHNDEPSHKVNFNCQL
jgi:hypothetical protein